MRLHDDEDAKAFAMWLLNIGQGRNHDENDEVDIPVNMRLPDIKSVMNFVYPNLE